MSELLTVRGLKVVFPTERGLVRAVEGVDVSVRPGQCVAIVGESGCGKSVFSLAVMRLLATPPAIMRAEEITFDGHDLQSLSEQQMLDIRGKDMCMIFQDALTALNPVMPVGKQLDELFLRHCRMNKAQAREASVDALRQVGVPAPEKRYHDYPHQLSGGMRQRVLIAMAFAVRPKLIIADEPTTALDVTIQAQVLDTLRRLQKENGTALILITHDLSVVAHMADEVYVMYCGRIVEKAPLRALFTDPAHPYTRGLLSAVPHLSGNGGRFVQIPDNVPSPLHRPAGCCFHPRCADCRQECTEKMPLLQEIGGGRLARCLYPIGGDRHG